MDDDHILEGLHNRIDNVKRDLLAKINNNREFNEAIITQLIQINLDMVVLSDQIFDVKILLKILKIICKIYFKTLIKIKYFIYSNI